MPHHRRWWSIGDQEDAAILGEWKEKTKADRRKVFPLSTKANSIITAERTLAGVLISSKRSTT